MKQFVCVILSLLFSCSTPYQVNGFKGGYSDSKIDEITFIVNFQGNGYTSQNLVTAYFLYRCCEVTINAGCAYFVFIEKNVDSKIKSRGNSAKANSARKISASGIIKVFKEEPTGYEVNFNAEDIKNKIEPFIERP